MGALIYQAGVLRERWDDATRTYTTFNASGAQTSTRPYTASENAEADSLALAVVVEANRNSIRDKAAQAIATNDAFLALGNPNNAQTLTQVQRLTRENTALIRLVIGALDSTDGT